MDGLDSEFICAVGRVLVCEPHPGADRLDLVTITISGDGGAFPYRLIVGRGDFKPGDRCVYVGPDSVVPLAEGSPFAFLSSRLDAKGKTEYRIRSARIRGLFSPGLVIPCSDVVVSDCSLRVGDDVSEHLHVRAHRSAAEEDPPGQSNVGGAKGAVPLSDPFPVYTVTALKKCPRLFEEGEPVVITEKMHGTNFRFGYGGGSRFYYGTHRTALADTRSAWRRFRDWLSGKRHRTGGTVQYGLLYKHAVDKFALDEIATTFPQLVFYGELYGKTHGGGNIQDLTYGATDTQLRVFDCWHGIERRWLTYEERSRVMGAMGKLGLNEVHILRTEPYSFDEVKRLAEQDSIYGGIREGVVIESTTGVRRKAKWVSERYHMRKDADA